MGVIMPRAQQKKTAVHKGRVKQNVSVHSGVRSWKEFISEKVLADYALPLTKNAEARLHELNEKIEQNLAH